MSRIYKVCFTEDCFHRSAERGQRCLKDLSWIRNERALFAVHIYTNVERTSPCLFYSPFYVGNIFNTVVTNVPVREEGDFEQPLLCIFSTSPFLSPFRFHPISSIYRLYVFSISSVHLFHKFSLFFFFNILRMETKKNRSIEIIEGKRKWESGRKSWNFFSYTNSAARGT